MSLSVIVPIYNEQDNITELTQRLIVSLKDIPGGYELVFVNDGSTDKTADILTELAAKYPGTVKLVQFARNFGQSAALAAGVQYARNPVVAFLDADLQNDPADIPRLIVKLTDGYDVVSGWRRKRADPLFTRRIPSYLANRLISRLTGIKLHDYGCTLKVYRREFLVKFRLYGEMHRLIPAYLAYHGARVTELEVNHYPRKYGKSKYTILRTFKVILDLVTAKFMLGYFSTPNYIFGGCGIVLLFLSFICATVVLINKFVYGIFAYRQPLLLVGIFLGLVGIQFIGLGLLAELFIRTHYASGENLPYVVNKTVGFPDVKDT